MKFSHLFPRSGSQEQNIFPHRSFSPKYGSLHCKVTLSVNSVQHSRLSFWLPCKAEQPVPPPLNITEVLESIPQSTVPVTPAVLQATGRNQEAQREEYSFFFPFFFLRQSKGGLFLCPGKMSRRQILSGWRFKKKKKKSSRVDKSFLLGGGKGKKKCCKVRSLSYDDHLRCPGSRGAPIS